MTYVCNCNSEGVTEGKLQKAKDEQQTPAQFFKRYPPNANCKRCVPHIKTALHNARNPR